METKAYARLRVDNDFMCERNLDLNTWECKGCPYYYLAGETGRLPKCLMSEVKEWTLYQIEVKDDKERNN